MTAVERGMQMLKIPQDQLPPLAMEFFNHLASKVGTCLEVYLTAFAVYAQCVEGLPCDDDLYRARGEDIEWFKKMELKPCPICGSKVVDAGMIDLFCEKCHCTFTFSLAEGRAPRNEIWNHREFAVSAIDIKSILRQLDEAGATGLDGSPGDQLSKEAAKVIRVLINE